MSDQEEFGQSRVHHSFVHDCSRLNVLLRWFQLAIRIFRNGLQMWGCKLAANCCKTCPVVRLALTDDDGDGRSTELRGTLGSEFSKGRLEGVAFPCSDLESIRG